MKSLQFAKGESFIEFLNFNGGSYFLEDYFFVSLGGGRGWTNSLD